MIRFLKILTVFAALTAAALGEEAVEKLTAEESVLLIHKIHRRATETRDKPIQYEWAADNAQKVIGCATCLSLMNKSLIQGIRVVEKPKSPSVEVVLRKGEDIPQEQFTQKEVVVKYRDYQSGRNWDMTYRFARYGEGLSIVTTMMSHLEILTTKE